jgi:hypothetical protein
MIGTGIILTNRQEANNTGGINLVYSFDELKKDLDIGHEVEFYYHEDRYSISCNKEGWYLTKFYDSESHQAFNTHEELLENGKINSESLREIWDDVRIDIIF